MTLKLMIYWLKSAWKHYLPGKIEFKGGSNFFNFLILAHKMAILYNTNTDTADTGKVFLVIFSFVLVSCFFLWK